MLAAGDKQELIKKGLPTMRTTTKEITSKIKEHVLEYFTQDMGHDSPDPVENLRNQIEYMKLPNESTYQTAIHLVEGGTLLVYHNDVDEFLSGLNINPAGKEYDEQKSWDLYKHLVAREVTKLV